MGRRPPPPHVAAWLERRLEAHGLDAAALYARYVISVLRAHHHDDDVATVAGGKATGKDAGGPRKRPRRALDADEARRAAAVRCLEAAASDQNYEIEALIDELCEKLKEVNNTENVDCSEKVEPKISTKISPKELAEKYYAAFPPLCPQSAQLVNLSPKWVSSISTHNSPKKVSSTRRRTRKQPIEKYHTSDSTMKSRGQVTSKQRLASLSRPKKESCSRNLSKTFEMYDDFNNFDFFALNNTLQAPSLANDQEIPETTNCCFEDDISNDVNMYDDLPVDISDLLNDSPNPHVAIMNLANMRDTGKKDFIQCGTNITSSIWSNNNDVKSDESCFSSLCASDWPDFGGKNEESMFNSLPNIWGSNDDLFDTITISLMKINHSKESSCFAEIVPEENTEIKPIESILNLVPIVQNNVNEKDDLLTSEKSHFKPINDKLEGKQYADGSTFVISNNLDEINYKRSNSGCMYLEDEFGQNKKYFEYKNSDINFVLKFCISQNDKACQTDDESDTEIINMKLDEKIIEKSVDCEQKVIKCSCDDNNDDCFYHPTCLNEINWKYEMQMCEKCKNNSNGTWEIEWNNKLKVQNDWDADNMKNIWNGGEICGSCLRLNVVTSPTSPQHSRLREDISQDGEQLLSDLSSLQRCYLGGPLSPCAPDDRKRRHSFLDLQDPWSFASRLREDCLISMGGLPTLRSVTL